MNLHEWQPFHAMAALRGTFGRLAISVFMLAGALIALLAVSTARAAETPRPVELLLNMLNIEMNLRPTARIIRPEGDGYVLEDITFAEGKMDDKVRFAITAKKILLQGAAPQDGLMLYRRIHVEDFRIRFSEGEKRVDIIAPGMDFSEASILPPENAQGEIEKFFAGRMAVSVMSIPEIRVEIPGFEPFYWRGIRATWEGDRRTGAGQQRTEFGTLRIPVMAMAEASRKTGSPTAGKDDEILRRLGLKELVFTGYSEATNKWLPNNLLQADFMSIMRFEKIGEFAISMDGVAIPLEFLRELRELGKRRMAAGTDQRQPLDPMAQQRLLASVQRLALVGLEIRWRDLGLTPALLEMKAEEVGMSVEALIDKLEAEANAKISQGPMPELRRRFVAAAMAFLRNPKSLRIAIRGKNGQPINFAGAFSLLLISPQMLENSVDIIIEANR